MKFKISTLLLLFLGLGYSTFATNVTFQVNMNEVVDAYTTPEVNGTFNGWCGECAPMTDANMDGIWEITIDLPAGNHEFKFAADGWNIQETLIPGSSCTLTTGAFTNRIITVANTPLVLDAACWGSCLDCGIAPEIYNVTFKVDMNNVVDAFTTPEVNGTFNEWCGGCAPMSDADMDGVWELVIPLEAGNYEFKYAADAWNIQEDLAPGSFCTVSAGGFTNRSLSVVDQDIVLDAVCWGSCLGCGVAPESFDVTFRVDMSQVEDPFTTPEVNGSFNEWCGACAPMTDLGAGIWELTITLEQGNYEFKFSADEWNIQESLTAGSSCTVTADGFTNRTLSVVDSNIDLGTVCWGSCTAECVAGPPMTPVTYNVDMSNEITFGTFDPVSHQVVVAGPYHFPSCGVVLTDPDLDGIYSGTVDYPIQTGIAYKFYRVENSDPIIPGITPCDNPEFIEVVTDNACLVGLDRYVVIGVDTSPINVNPVCWGECALCAPLGGPYDVTFRVDMSNVTDAFTTPEVNGDFNGFCGSCAPMTDLGGGVWELTISLDPGTYAFKYSADEWNIQEELAPGSSCTVTADGFTNRTVTVMNSNVDLGTVCWGACVDCASLPTFYDVTFKVDMNEVTDAFTTPEVNGEFNNWCGGCAVMTDDDLDGVWELVISLEAGDYEYKFAADEWNIQEELMQGMSCTVSEGGFTNRLLSVVDQDVDLGTVCWASCQECGIAPELYNVTFKVDMNQVTDAFTTPEVNGEFNGWCGACAPMTDDDLDGVWELTIGLEAGSYEFKYSADEWNIQEELMEGMSCTITTDGFTNRTLTVVDQDMEMDVVCWASCLACEPDAVSEASELISTVYPNPLGSDILFVQTKSLNNTPVIVEIYDNQGRLVQSEQFNQSNSILEVNTKELSNGMYNLVLRSDVAFSSTGFIINK